MTALLEEAIVQVNNERIIANREAWIKERETDKLANFLARYVRRKYGLPAVAEQRDTGRRDIVVSFGSMNPAHWAIIGLSEISVIYLAPDNVRDQVRSKFGWNTGSSGWINVGTKNEIRYGVLGCLLRSTAIELVRKNQLVNPPSKSWIKRCMFFMISTNPDCQPTNWRSGHVEQ